jgi:23S rRNA (uridine2552-2'-O)-methyltransferase
MPKPYTPNDKWSQRAQREGFRARSVYKLMELDERFHLLKPGMTVLDLGAAPGSWMQYAITSVGPKGKVIGMDLQTIESIDGATTIVQDITNTAGVLNTLAALNVDHVDVILSDLAPSTSGIKDVDQWRSIELNQCVVDVAQRILAPGGTCVMKVLRGADFDAFLRELKARWGTVRTAQAHASRDRSKEIYIVAIPNTRHRGHPAR